MPNRVDTRTYMEEVDEEKDEIIDDTRTYVSGAAPGSSLKEEANVSRTRNKERLRRRDSASPNIMHTDSDSTAHPNSPLRRESKMHRPRDKVRDKAKEKRPSAQPAARPAMKGSKTMPTIQTGAKRQSQQQQEDPSWYGISPNTQSPIAVAAATHARSRSYTVNPNQRQHGYFPPSASKPPLANTKYWPNQTPPLGTSFPPPAPYHPVPSPSLYHAPYPPPQAMPPLPPPSDYFGQVPLDPRNSLMARFDAHRPRSAMARHFPSPAAIAYGNDFDDDLEDGGVVLERNASLRRRSSRREEDRMRMPPPQRPKTSRPISTGGPFAPPPMSRTNRHSVGSVGSLGYDEDSLDDESSYQDASPPTTYDYRPYPVRRPSIDSPTVYEGGTRYLEMGRRNSQYGARNKSTERGMEDQMRIARQYQDAVDGPVEPLTLDSLRKINRTPSRDIKSMGSRDESGYGLRSAAPTRNSVEEDITIVVKGTASLNIGNTHLNVKEGTEIRIPTNPGTDRESRGGSDNASTAYEERGPVFERPIPRNRASSRTASRSRGQSFHGHHPFHPQSEYGGTPPLYHDPHMPLAFAPHSGYSYPSQF